MAKISLAGFKDPVSPPALHHLDARRGPGHRGGHDPGAGGHLDPLVLLRGLPQGAGRHDHRLPALGALRDQLHGLPHAGQRQPGDLPASTRPRRWASSCRRSANNYELAAQRRERSRAHDDRGQVHAVPQPARRARSRRPGHQDRPPDAQRQGHHVHDLPQPDRARRGLPPHPQEPQDRRAEHEARELHDDDGVLPLPRARGEGARSGHVRRVSHARLRASSPPSHAATADFVARSTARSPWRSTRKSRRRSWRPGSRWSPASARPSSQQPIARTAPRAVRRSVRCSRRSGPSTSAARVTRTPFCLAATARRCRTRLSSRSRRTIKDPKGHPVVSKLIPEKCVMCHTKDEAELLQRMPPRQAGGLHLRSRQAVGSAASQGGRQVRPQVVH